MNRAAIFDALYTRLTGIAGLTSHAKRVALFDVPPAEQPRLMLEPDEQSGSTNPGQPTRWSLRFDVYLLAHDDSASGPAPTLLGLVDKIEDALRAQVGEHPKSGPATTLGDTVIAARISGAVQFDRDDTGAQGGAKVPVEVIAL